MAERYASIRRVATDYASMMGPLCERLEDAETVVFHGSLGMLPARVAALQKSQRWVGYIVWEAEQLPEAAKPMLARFDEVWTASSYCARVLSQHHGNVHVVPHVAEPPAAYASQHRSYVDRMLERMPDDVILLALAAWDDPRKNLAQLMRCFARLQLPGLRLVVKTVPPMPRMGARTDSVWWSQWVDAPTMVALLDACDCLVSFHHSEGWGLNLSDAMVLGKLAVATGYSGNLDFMHEENSILVPYTLGPVGGAQSPFTADMRWAHLRDADVEHALATAYAAVRNGRAQELGTRAQQDMQKFSRAAVAAKVARRVAAW